MKVVARTEKEGTSKLTALWPAQQTGETFTGHSVNDAEVRGLSEKTNPS
jgi:hypothetical protein